MTPLIVVLVAAVAYLAAGAEPGEKASVTSASAPTSASKDSDHDHLPDQWEQRYHLSTSKNSAKGDPDHDGLDNRREYRLRTNPRKRDTDRDGYSDRIEVQSGTKATSAESRPFPNPATTGVPAGWKPSKTLTDDLEVTRAGAVIEDVLLRGADILVDAPDVTIRRVKLQGGKILNQVDGCGTGMVVRNTTFEPVPGQPYTPTDTPAIGEGGYTAEDVEVINRGEGFRASDCGPVRIENSYAYVLGDDPGCDRSLHSDGIQGFNARGLELENASLIFGNECGTSPFFIGDSPADPNTGNYSIDHLLVSGAGYSFRMGVRGSVTGLRIVKNAWEYGPMDVKCSVIRDWEAKIVTVDSDYQVKGVARKQPCNTEGGE